MIQMQKWHPISLLLVCTIWSFAAYAVHNLEYESRIADKLVDGLDVGEVIWLGNGQQKFLGIFTQMFSDEDRYAVLIIHSMGAHPDWPDVIAPLRRKLPERKLATLSIQMPVLAPEETISVYGQTLDEAARRIRLAVDFLHNKGFSQVIIAGYSFGAATAAYYLAHQEQHGISAFVGISMLARKFLNPSLDLNLLLEKIEIPILDIYGSNDLARVLKETPDRRLAVHKSGNRLFEQVEIQDSGHIYTGHEDHLVDMILEWNAKHKQSEGIEIGRMKSDGNVEKSNVSE